MDDATTFDRLIRQVYRKLDVVASIGHVPCIVHQTCKTIDVPPHWQPSYDSWQQLGDRWVYILWTDEMNAHFMKTYYPEFVSLYESYPYGINRADVVRYFLLHRFGGLYVDLDIQAKPEAFVAWYAAETQNITTHNVWLGQSATSGEFKGSNQRLTNAFMMSSRRATFWPDFVWPELVRRATSNDLTLAERAVLRWQPSRHMFVIFSTGPGMLNASYQQYKSRLHVPHDSKGRCWSCDLPTLDIREVDRELVSPVYEWQTKPATTDKALVITLDGGSWHAFDSKLAGAVSRMNHTIVTNPNTSRIVLLIVSIVILIVLIRSRFAH